eukprot:g28081.t1
MLPYCFLFLCQADDLLSCLQSLQQNVTISPAPSPLPSIMDLGKAGSNPVNTEPQAFVNNIKEAVSDCCEFACNGMICPFSWYSIVNKQLDVDIMDPGFVVQSLIQDRSGIQDIFQLLCTYGSNVTRGRIQDSEREADQLRKKAKRDHEM